MAAPAAGKSDQPLEILCGTPKAGRVAGTLSKAARVIVITPDAELFAELEDRFAGDDKVDVVAAGLAAESGPSEWVRYNEPGLCSFRAPTNRLRQLLPGLSARVTALAERITFSELVERFGLIGGRISLEIDAPGEELAIIREIGSYEPKGAIQSILLRTSRQILFEGGSPIDAQIRALRGEDYYLEARNDADFDRPVLRFAYDGEQQKVRDQLRDDLSVATRMQSLLKADIDELRSRYEASESVRAEQADLLKKLTIRLRESARRLQAGDSLEGAGGR